MLYPNLEAEMARKNIKQRDIALKFGKSPSVVCYWLSDNDYQLGSQTCFVIRDTFFPEMPFEYLFSEEPKTFDFRDAV